MNQNPIINNIIKTFGINRKTTLSSFKKSGLNTKKNLKFLKPKQNLEINKNFINESIGKKLSNSIKENIEFLFKIKTYRGIRHKLKYPARGQRTHTNAKTKQKFKF
jgi:small subunit ribosomal protein S13